MKIKYLYLLGLILTCLLACDDVEKNDPRGSTEIPKQVTNVTVNNMNGYSVIYYDRPDDINLKYVKAVYQLDNGETRQYNASYYTDSIKVDGFAQAGEYEIKLYSVSYGETESQPITIQVNPEIPPYQIARQNAMLEAYWGGVRVKTEIPEEGESSLAFTFVKKNQQENRWEEIGAYYTKAAVISYTQRGQDAVEAEFGVYIRDRWGNTTDTLTIVTTPWFEVECDKNLFRSTPMPTDTYECHTWGGISNQNSVSVLWDNLKQWDQCFHTKASDPIPQWFTIDLGRTYKLSRLVIHWRGTTGYTGALFTSGCVKDWELWGSMEPDRITGAFEPSWYKLGDFVTRRLDGTTLPTTISALTDAEREILETGQEFEMPDEAAETRYIRFKSNSTYGSVNTVMMSELTFFGEPRD